MRKNLINFIIVIVITVLAALIVYPKGPNFGKETKMHLGLDLQGGIQLLYQIDMSNIKDRQPSQVQSETIDLVRRRVDDLGVSEPQISASRIGEDYGVMIELPGIKDIEQAKQIIGKTAQLRFYELDDSGQERPTELTGSDVTKAQAGTDTSQAGFSSASPIIYLEFR